MGSMRRSCAPAMVRGRPRSLPMYQSRPPVALIPAATTKSVATVSRPSLAKPARPSSTVTTPDAMRSASAPIMTWSGWMRSHSRHPNAKTTTATVNHPSHAAPIVRRARAERGRRRKCRGSLSAPVPACGGGRAERSRARDERGRGDDDDPSSSLRRPNARASERGDSLTRHVRRARASVHHRGGGSADLNHAWSGRAVLSGGTEIVLRRRMTSF